MKTPLQDEYEKIIDSEDRKENDFESQKVDINSPFKTNDRDNKKKTSQKGNENSPEVSPNIHQITRNKNIYIDFIEKEKNTKEKEDENAKNFVLFFPDFYDIDLL